MRNLGNLVIPEEYAFAEVAEGGNARIVTPTDPLIINATQMGLDEIEIQGGVISTVVETTVDINKLTKTS